MVNLLAKFLGDLSLESHYLKGMTFSEHCRTPAKRGKKKKVRYYITEH